MTACLLPRACGTVSVGPNRFDTSRLQLGATTGPSTSRGAGGASRILAGIRDQRDEPPEACNRVYSTLD